MLKKKNYHSSKEDIIIPHGFSPQKIISSGKKEKKRISKFILISFLFLFLFSCVSAVPPVTTVQSYPQGYTLVEQQIESIKSNQDYKYHIFVTNASNGYYVDNDSVECNFFLADIKGEVIFSSNFEYKGIYWEVEIPRSNLTKGQHPYGVGCYNGGIGGSLSGTFDITILGTELTEQKSLLYSGLLAISILLFLGLTFVGIKLPSKNKSNELTGYIIAVSNLKYLKYFMLSLAYLNLVWTSYLLWMINYAYLDFNFMTTIFKFFFYFLVATILPLFILVIYIVIANFIRDQKIADFLQRGLRVNG